MLNIDIKYKKQNYNIQRVHKCSVNKYLNKTHRKYNSAITSTKIVNKQIGKYTVYKTTRTRDRRHLPITIRIVYRLIISFIEMLLVV